MIVMILGLVLVAIYFQFQDMSAPSVSFLADNEQQVISYYLDSRIFDFATSDAGLILQEKQNTAQVVLPMNDVVQHTLINWISLQDKGHELLVPPNECQVIRIDVAYETGSVDLTKQLRNFTCVQQ
jgi:hypothetical protein